MAHGIPTGNAQSSGNTVPTLRNHRCCWCGKLINGKAVVRWDPNKIPKTAIHPTCVLTLYNQAVHAASLEVVPMVLEARVDGVDWREKEQG